MAESQSPIRYIKLFAPAWSFLANTDHFPPLFFKDSALKDPEKIVSMLGKAVPIQNGALSLAWPRLSPVSAAARGQKEEGMEEVSALIKHYREKTFTELLLIRKLIVESGVWERPPQDGDAAGAAEDDEEKIKATAKAHAENDKCLRALMALLIVTDAIAHNAIARDHPFTDEFTAHYQGWLKNDCALFMESCAKCLHEAGMVAMDEPQDGSQEWGGETALQAFRKAGRELQKKWDGPENVWAENIFAFLFNAPLELQPDFFPEGFHAEPQAEEEWKKQQDPEDKLIPQHQDLPLISLRPEFLKNPAQLEKFFGPFDYEVPPDAVPDLFPGQSLIENITAQEWKTALAQIKGLKALLDRSGIDYAIALSHQAEEKSGSNKNALPLAMIADYIQKRFFESPKSPVARHNPYSFRYLQYLKASSPETVEAAQEKTMLIDRFIQDAAVVIAKLSGKPPAPQKAGPPPSRFKQRKRGGR